MGGTPRGTVFCLHLRESASVCVQSQLTPPTATVTFSSVCLSFEQKNSNRRRNMRLLRPVDVWCDVSPSVFLSALFKAVPNQPGREDVLLEEGQAPLQRPCLCSSVREASCVLRGRNTPLCLVRPQHTPLHSASPQFLLFPASCRRHMMFFYCDSLEYQMLCCVTGRRCPGDLQSFRI